MPRRIRVPCSSLGRARTLAAGRCAAVRAGTHRSSRCGARAGTAGHTRSTSTTAGRQAVRSSVLLSLIGGGGPVLGWSRCPSPAGPARCRLEPWCRGGGPVGDGRGGWCSCSEGGTAARGPATPAGACRPRHFGREGVSWREGDLSPPANGRDTLRSVGRSPSIGRSPRTGITRATGPGCVGPPPIAPPSPVVGGGWWGSQLCAGGTSGPALNRTGSPLGTGTPDQGVLHPCGLVVGVAASRGPVIAPA